jgi:putative redox protein
MDVISILRKMRQDVSEYRIEVTGTRAAAHPRVFTDIVVEHVVIGTNLSADAVARAVHLSWERYCSVSAMLSRGARLTHTFRIEEATPEAKSA